VIGEIWTYVAVKPNNGFNKVRPVLVIGNDGNNNLQFVDIHYVIISASSECGSYDIRLSQEIAKTIGLQKESIIKTTKLYTGPKSKLGEKIGDLPSDLRQEFLKKYRLYQENVMTNLQ